MNINIDNLIGKLEIHCTGETIDNNVIAESIKEIFKSAFAGISQELGKENTSPCKDENLCEKAKFNQQDIETIATCYNRVAELLGWKRLDSSKVFIYLLNK